MAQPAAQAAKTVFRRFRELHGVVISAGLMDKTVKVRVGGQKWNNWVKKVCLPPEARPTLRQREAESKRQKREAQDS